MGLLQKAVETYDAMAHRAGKVYADEKEPLAPISHILTRAQIEIALDQDGRFLSARAVDKEEPKIMIPVTEESAGRTSAPCAHPLCDQLGYVAPGDKKKHQLYVAALSDWADSGFSHPMLVPILRYVRSGTILSDLSGAGIIQLTPEGKPEEEKAMVRWVVNGLGEGVSGQCWEDQGLMNAYISYIGAKQRDMPAALCMVSGALEPPAGQHPKGIVPINGNAKLISANDSSGFTYRGRFDDPAQAATVGYTASQKAHCALRWLVANQGASFGGRTFLCWNPQGRKVPSVTRSMARLGSERQRAANPTQYREQLKEALSGWKTELPDQAGVVIATFDAATTGRLAVTYYNELLASDFLDRLHDWEASCCWENGPYGIQSPSLFQIVSWAYGTPRNGKPDPDDRILAQQMQRLVACRVEQAPLPLDLERALVDRASNLQLFPEMVEERSGKAKEKIRKYPRAGLLFTACAAIRKVRQILFEGEKLDMGLNKNCKDRSYLFGRLLAIAEAVENSTYTDEDRRETNAMRMQKAFAQRPFMVWRSLEEKLEPYYKQLKPGLREYYRKLTQEIMDKLEIPNGGEELDQKMAELNTKLADIYLIGYYHQRAYRNESSNKPKTEEEN